MPTKLSFQETLQGAFAWGPKDPRAGALEGAKRGTSFGFDGTIVMDDLDRFIADPQHQASFDGKYLGNLFEAQNLPPATLVSAAFKFMAPGPGAPRRMVHEHTLLSGDKTYSLLGIKYLEGDPLESHTLADLTTLDTTLSDEQGNVLAAGVLRFPMRDFLKLVMSFTATGDDRPLVAKMKFLRLFLREETYVLLTGFRRTAVPKEVRRRLAKDPSTRQKRYDVVVIGSGYGGGVAAARLSAPRDGKPPKTVCVLERGRDLRAGDFPTEPWQLAAEVKSPLSPQGLFEFVDAGDIEALVGNGLGGTSLINANVMLEAERAVFDQPAWPMELPDLAPYYARALAMIQPVPHPSPPVKATVLRDAVRAAAKKERTTPPDVVTVPIAVNFREDYARPDTGNVQAKCVDCGACVTGCNVTAKSTVDLNYLSVAERQGADIYVETEVVALEDRGDSFDVHLAETDGTHSIVQAQQVVLAAGVLGSFRILKRSERAYGLRLSTTLGTRFSGNGDILGFGYDTREPAEPTAGPTITSLVTYDQDPDVRKHFILEDGGVPPAATAIVRAALPLIDRTHPPGSEGVFAHMRDWVRETADVVGLTSFGALRRSILYFGMGTENTTGQLRLEDGAVKVTWPHVAHEEFVKPIDDRMRAFTLAIGGSYVENPDARTFLRKKLITAHPLGGCPMGSDVSTGVVDVNGAVFGQEGRLFVADGSIVPTAIGRNPALTIAALAEHICEGIIRAWA